MKGIEDENEDLKGALPRTYNLIPNWVLVELLKSFAPVNIPGDAFGACTKYFMGNFAKQTMQKAGVLHAGSIVKLIVEIIEPYHGRIFDPPVAPAACSSTARASCKGTKDAQQRNKRFRHGKNRRNLAHGQAQPRHPRAFRRHPRCQHLLRRPASILRQAGGRFDFVMANPPFNVSGVDKERLKDDPRFPFAYPTRITAITYGFRYSIRR